MLQKNREIGLCCETSTRLLLAANSAMGNSKDKDNQIPLFVATEQRDLGVIKALLDNGADANAQGGHYSTAMHSRRLRKEVTKML